MVAPFVFGVAVNLCSADDATQRTAWAYFDAITSFPAATCEVLQYAQVATQLASIVNLDDHWILKRFIEFSLRAWTEQGDQAPGLMCGALLGSIGSISCMVKSKHGLFGDDKAMIELVEHWYEVMTNLNAPDTDEFVATLARHIAPGTVRTRTPRREGRNSHRSISSARSSGRASGFL
jgi:hypothetical protein